MSPSTPGTLDNASDGFDHVLLVINIVLQCCRCRLRTKIEGSNYSAIHSVWSCMSNSYKHCMVYNCPFQINAKAMPKVLHISDHIPINILTASAAGSPFVSFGALTAGLLCAKKSILMAIASPACNATTTMSSIFDVRTSVALRTG